METTAIDVSIESLLERDRNGAKTLSCRGCEVQKESTFCSLLLNHNAGRQATNRCLAELPANMIVFREGDPAENLYSVASGALKLYKLLSDGRRQIIGFVFSGDMFGLAADGPYPYTAETLVPSKVCGFTARKLDGLAVEIPLLERRMFMRAVRDLVAAQDQMLLLGRKTAREKLATFLLGLSSRLERQGLPRDQVPLPMSRTDIADYLGLTIETVSRVFTQFRKESLIELPNAGRANLTDHVQLKDIAEGLRPAG